MFIILDFYFLGLTYIIVYVGAIAILFLFVIMMTETLFTPPAEASSGKIASSHLLGEASIRGPDRAFSVPTIST